MSNPKKPTHKLCMKPVMGNEKWATVGAAWENENANGRWLALRLNRGVVLSWRDAEDMKLAIFEANQ